MFCGNILLFLKRKLDTVSISPKWLEFSRFKILIDLNFTVTIKTHLFLIFQRQAIQDSNNFLCPAQNLLTEEYQIHLRALTENTKYYKLGNILNNFLYKMMRSNCKIFPYLNLIIYEDMSTEHETLQKGCTIL